MSDVSAVDPIQMISKNSQWHHWLSILWAWLLSFTFTICDTCHTATLYAGACAGYGCTSGATSTTFGRGSTIWQFRFHREVASCEHSVADATSRSCVHEKKYMETQHPFWPFWTFLIDKYTYIWSRFAVRYPPPPPHGMVPKPAFCSIPHENVVFAVFFAWWVAGAVRNLQIRWIFATNLPKTCYLQCFGFDIVE